MSRFPKFNVWRGGSVVFKAFFFFSVVVVDSAEFVSTCVIFPVSRFSLTLRLFVFFHTCHFTGGVSCFFLSFFFTVSSFCSFTFEEFSVKCIDFRVIFNPFTNLRRISVLLPCSLSSILILRFLQCKDSRLKAPGWYFSHTFFCLSL